MKFFHFLSQFRKIPAQQTRAGVFPLLGSLIIGFGLMGISGCTQSTQTPVAGVHSQSASAVQAEELYEEAWKILQIEYVDESYNGQKWDQWRTHYRGKLQDAQDAYVAIATMAASLNDEYTRFLPPRDMSEQTMSIDSKLYGVGIQISKRENKLLVLATIDDTPAEKAGLLPKDQIIRIDGQPTTGMSVEDAADHIRGEKGTYVTLKIKRGSEEFDKQIQRDEIKLKSVFTRSLDDSRIGYLRLSSFISENMLTEIEDKMKGLEDKQALIIDLRENYGGLLGNAVEIADMLLDKGAIVYIVNRNNDRRAYEAQPGTLYSKPLVVLIDGGSASASEILAGALKDNHRATLIGTRSFGKGLVQKINSLSDGSGLNITISKYLTPNGTDINKKGIAPQITVHYTEQDFLAHRDPQLDEAVHFLKINYLEKK